MTIRLGHPPPHAQSLVEAVVYGHHARLDHHLLDRDIEDVQHPLDVADDIRRVFDHQHVGAFVHAHCASGREQLGALGGEQGRHFGCLGIVDLQIFGIERRQIGHLIAALQLLFLSCGNLVRRGHQQDVVVQPLVEPSDLENDVERLFPGHTIETQRDIAGDGIRGHQVEIIEVGDDLQHGSNRNILEVQRDWLALILFRCRGGDPLFHLYDEHLVGLVVAIIKLAIDRKFKQGVIALTEHLHLGDRGRKILHIDKIQLIIRDPGTVELGEHLLATAAHIHRRRAVVQGHQKLPLSLLATAKIHPLDRVEISTACIHLRDGQHGFAGSNRGGSRHGRGDSRGLVLRLVLGDPLGINQCRLGNRLAPDKGRRTGSRGDRSRSHRLTGLLSQ
ncbi:hypothetical protein D3C78_292680 [compost metagenome]